MALNKRKFGGCEYFEIYNGIKGFANCKIEGCGYRYTPVEGAPVHSKPLRDHFKRKHADMYQKCESEAKKSKSETTHTTDHFKRGANFSHNAALQKSHTIKYETSPAKIQRLAVNAVTNDGLPFSVFEKKSLRKILQPILSKLGINLNRRPLRELTLQKAKERLDSIKEKLQGCLVSLKVVM